MDQGRESFQERTARIARAHAARPPQPDFDDDALDSLTPEPDLPPELPAALLRDLETLPGNSRRFGLRRRRFRIPGLRFGMPLMLGVVGYSVFIADGSGNGNGYNGRALQGGAGSFVSAHSSSSGRSAPLVSVSHTGDANVDIAQELADKGFGAHAYALEKTGVLDQVQDALDSIADSIKAVSR